MQLDIFLKKINLCTHLNDSLFEIIDFSKIIIAVCLSVCCYSQPTPPCLFGRVRFCSPPASPVSHLAGLLTRRDPSTNPGPTAWCVSVASEEICGMFVSATKGAEC